MPAYACSSLHNATSDTLGDGSAREAVRLASSAEHRHRRRHHYAYAGSSEKSARKCAGILMQRLVQLHQAPCPCRAACGLWCGGRVVRSPPLPGGAGGGGQPRPPAAAPQGMGRQRCLVGRRAEAGRGVLLVKRNGVPTVLGMRAAGGDRHVYRKKWRVGVADGMQGRGMYALYDARMHAYAK